MVRVAHKYMPDHMSEAELKATFAAREHTLDYLVAALRSQIDKQTLTSYLLTGPRGSGKTTLMRLLHLALCEDAELQTAWLPVRFPEELPNVTSLRDLLAAALEVLADQGVPEAHTWHERVEAERDDEASQELAITGLRQIAQAQGRRLVLMIENLDMLFERGLTNGTRATLRRLLMTDPFMMIVASAVQVFPAVKAYDEAFFNYFCPAPLERLNDEQACEILRRRAQWEGNDRFESLYRQHQSKIRTISLLTGGNPRLLLMLYEILTLREVGSAVQTLRVLVDELTPLLKDIIEHQLPPQQVSILDALMRLDGKATPSQLAQKSRLPLNIITTQLKRLTEADILELQGGGKGRPAWYTVRDRLFYTWYQMRYLRPQRRRIEMFVQVLEIWYEADERLKAIETLSSSLTGCPRTHARSLAETTEYFAASLERTPHFETARAMAIRNWVHAGDFKEAVCVFNEWERQAPRAQQGDASESYLGLSEWLTEHGDKALAIEVLKTRLTEAPNDLSALMKYGIILGQSADHAQALSCFDRILKSDPTDALALFNRGVAKRMLEDFQGALSDFTAVIELPEATVEQVARALVNRGVAKSKLEDLKGEIDDYTAVIELPEAPVERVAQALFNRGVAKRMQQDLQGEIDDCTAVIELPEATVEQVANALVNRGVAKSKLEDLTGAIDDYTAVIELPEAPVEQIARALVNRGVAKGNHEDHEGALADFTAVIELPEAPVEQVARALVNRGVAKRVQQDLQGEIDDYTTVIELPQAPVELVAKALVNRGVAKGNHEDHKGALVDFTAMIELANAPAEQLDDALFNHGLAKSNLGHKDDALSDWVDIMRRAGVPAELKIRATRLALHTIFAEDAEEGLGPVTDALEEWLTGLASEDRASRLMDLLMALARPEGRKAWIYAYENFVKGRGEAMAAELEVFRPVAEVLATGDRTKLDPLAPEQRAFALDVLKRFEPPEPHDPSAA